MYMRKNFKSLLKVFWQSGQTRILRVQNNIFFWKIVLSRSLFLFIQFLTFRKKNSDFRKRFLSGFLEKYSTSPDGRCSEKKVFLKQFYTSTSPSFSNSERKRKINFGRKMFGKVFKNAFYALRVTISGKQLFFETGDFSSFLEFGSSIIRKILRKSRKVVNTELYVSSGAL